MKKIKLTSLKHAAFVFLFIVINSVFISTAVQEVNAEPITFLYEGTVNFVDPVLSGTSFSVGDTFSVQYTFDPLTPDSNASANRGFYNNAISSLSVTIGGYSATASGLDVISADDNLSGADQYRIDLVNPMSGPSVNGWNISTQTALLQLRDTTETALSSDALPTTPPDPADFTSGGEGTFLALEFIDPLSDPFNPDMAFVIADVSSAIIIPSAIELTASGFEPPMDNGPVKVKKNRVLPLKTQLFDSGGFAITDLDITAPPLLQVIYDSGTGPAVDVTVDALPAGQGTEGNQFVFTTGGKWQFNLKTKNYTGPGTYMISIISGDDAEYIINPTSVASFVIE